MDSPLRPVMSAFLLGQARLLVDDKQVLRNQGALSRGRSLLYYLLIQPGHTARRSEAIEAIWPHLGREAGRNSCSKALHAIRSMLVECGFPSEALVADRQQITLVLGGQLTVDVVQFELGLKRRHDRRSALRQALALYAGDLLATEVDSDWAEQHRRALSQTRRDAAIELAEIDLRNGAPLATVPELEAALRSDGTDEALHRALIRAFASAGQLDRARLQYDRCASILVRELGEEPSPETSQLLFAGAREPAIAPSALARFEPPVPLTPIVGREREIDALESMLLYGDARLVTLLGPGGVGKTRLSLEIAYRARDRFSRGVAIVELAAVRDWAIVNQAIAGRLGIELLGSQSLATRLESVLGDAELLLVLDNMEQVVQAGPGLIELLKACPGLRLLVTSREPLHLQAERVVPIPPLETIDVERGPVPSLARITRNDAVQLFLLRAEAAGAPLVLDDSAALAIATVCRKLDGLPLAIELAAARMRTERPEGLLAELHHRLSTLTGGFHDSPERHRTMRAAIGWSVELLSPIERELFESISVFVGGASVDAVEAVAGFAPLRRTLDLLIAKSLLSGESEGASYQRVGMLETIREYGLELLGESPSQTRRMRAHADWFLRLASDAAEHLYGGEQSEWLERLEQDLPNFRAVLSWLIKTGDAPSALRLGACLWRLWLARSMFAEGVRWLEQIVDLPTGEPSVDLAEVWYGLGSLQNRIGNYQAVELAHDTALALWIRFDNASGTARALTALAALSRRNGAYTEALARLNEAFGISRNVGYLAGEATALNHIGLVLTVQGQDAEAEPFFAESLLLHEKLDDHYAVTILLNNLGEIANRRGDLDTAQEYYERALVLSRELDSRDGIAAELVNLAGVSLQLGEIDRAKRLATEAVAELRALGDVDYLAQALGMLGEAHSMLGDRGQARISFAEALQLNRRRNDLPEIATCLEAISELEAGRGNDERAVILLSVSATLRRSIGVPLIASERQRIEEQLIELRGSLGDERYHPAWDHGAAMELAAAIDQILVEAR